MARTMRTADRSEPQALGRALGRLSPKANALNKLFEWLNGQRTDSDRDRELSGWQKDDDVRAHVNYNLGSEYSWTSGPKATGGTLDFKDHPMDLDRTPSTNTTAPDWK